MVELLRLLVRVPVLKTDPAYLGRSVYDFPDLVVPPRELGPDGQPLDANAPQLKDFQLTGLNWLAYCWSKSENGILADEVSESCGVIFVVTMLISIVLVS